MTGSCAFIALVLAIRLIPLSTTMVFFYSYPAFAAIFSPIVFGEKISSGEVFGIALAILGVAILFDFKFEGGIIGQLMAMTGAVFAGITVALIKKLRETHGSVIIYFYFCMIGTVLSIGPFSVDPQFPDLTIEWCIVGGIIFTSIVAQLMMNQGFRYCKSWEGVLEFWSNGVLEKTVSLEFKKK